MAGKSKTTSQNQITLVANIVFLAELNHVTLEQRLILSMFIRCYLCPNFFKDLYIFAVSAVNGFWLRLCRAVTSVINYLSDRKKETRVLPYFRSSTICKNSMDPRESVSECSATIRAPGATIELCARDRSVIPANSLPQGGPR